MYTEDSRLMIEYFIEPSNKCAARREWNERIKDLIFEKNLTPTM